MTRIPQIFARQQCRIVESRLKVHWLWRELHPLGALLAVLPMQSNGERPNLTTMQRALVVTGYAHCDLVVQSAEGFALSSHQIENWRRILRLNEPPLLMFPVVLLAMESHAHAQTSRLITAAALSILEVLRTEKYRRIVR